MSYVPRGWASPPDFLRSRGRTIGLFLGALVLVGLGLIGLELARIRADLTDGRNGLASLDLATVDASGGVAAVVSRATDHMEAADHRARSSPVLGLLRQVPGVGGQIEALRDLTGAAAELGRRGEETATRLQAVMDAPRTPASRLDLARSVASELEELSNDLQGFEIGADGWLVPPLAWAREDLDVELIEARASLRRASTASAALAEFLTGPRRYLIAAGNNAEMRSGGVITASGVAEVLDGEIDVGEFLPNDRRAASEAPVPVPQEWYDVYAWRWGNYRYPGTTYTPNFPVAASIIGEISARNQHGPVDGVLYVDTFTLAAVLEVVGPVTVDGITFDHTNVIHRILYENYLVYGDLEDNPVRKELQGDIAEAAFDAIGERDYSLFALAGALSEMAKTRHLLGWAADPVEHDLWETLGVDGHLEADDVFVEVANLGASKLDYFVTVAVDLTTEYDSEIDARRGRMAVTITNPEREQTSPYIEGFSGLIEEPGEHVAWLGWFLPQYATGITAVDFPGFSQSGPDGPLYVSGTVVHVPLGESRTYTVEFILPGDQYFLTVLPSARVRPTVWTINGSDPLLDFVAFRYDLETGDVDLDDRSRG